MYLRRKIDFFLEEWKADSNRKPLIIKGARQIGKTASIMHFAESHYNNIVYINFALEPKYKVIVTDGYSTTDIIRNISLLNPEFSFKEGETVIIFDELQDCPDIASSLKSFCINGQYDVICSGSMLGINYKKINSNSLGYKTDYQMFSMDFEEFLWAKNRDMLVEDIKDHMFYLKPFSDVEFQILDNLFLDYSVLGGMPSVVSNYIEKNSFESSLKLQREIYDGYEEDARKYSEGLDQTKIVNVLRSVPSQLAKENKKFQFSYVAKGARSREYRGCIDWLFDCGLVNLCYCLHFPELPLKGNDDTDSFKVYFADTGILVSRLDEEAQQDLRMNKNLGTYKGALFENIIAEAFVKQGLELHYYKKGDSTLEEDFFVRDSDSIIPVEVKSGRAFSQSLNTLIKSEHYPDVKKGIKFCSKNIGSSNNIATFPYFCAFNTKNWLKVAKW